MCAGPWPRCASRLDIDDQPWLLRLANLQHLATSVTGRLAGLPQPTGTATALGEHASALALAAALHPTAAVCGTPAGAAMELIRELEGMDRGRYAGPVGWVDAHGNGEWGIALRCAELDGPRARLFAGCGIVADSDPVAELAETQVKFRPHAGRAGRAGRLTPCYPAASPARRSRPPRPPPSRRHAARRAGPRPPRARSAPRPPAARARPAPRPGPRGAPAWRTAARRPGPGCSRSAPCGVPKTRSNGPANAACSRSEKIPPPSLLTTTRHRSGRGSSGPSSRPGASCRNARSPSRATAGPPPAAWCASAAPIAEETSPSTAAGAAAGQHPDPGPRRHVQVQVADRQAGRRPQQRAVRQRGRQVTGQPGLGERLARVEDRVGGAAAPRRRPAARPRARPSRGPGPGRGPDSRDRRRHVGRAPGRVGPAPGSLGEHHVPGRRGPGPAAQERQLAAGQPGPAGRDDDLGPVPGDESRRAEQVAVGRQRVRAAPGAGRRLGEHRPARRLGQLEQRRRVVVTVPADHHPALGPLQPQRLAAVRGRAGRGRGRPPHAVHGAPPGRPSSGSGQSPPAVGRRVGASGTSGSRSGRLTCTGPGKPPAAPDASAQARQASDRQ